MTPHPTSPKTYYIVYVALLALLALTVLASGTEHKQLNNVLAVTIAVTKAVLIVLYFMHLRDGSHLTRVFAVAGFLWLAILLWLTLSDYRTRSWTPASSRFSTRAKDDPVAAPDLTNPGTGRPAIAQAEKATGPFLTVMGSSEIVWGHHANIQSSRIGWNGVLCAQPGVGRQRLFATLNGPKLFFIPCR